MLKESHIFRKKASNGLSWGGVRNFVYLSYANFIPNGEKAKHLHREIDVISFMVKGRVLHEDPLEDGKILEEEEIQV